MTDDSLLWPQRPVDRLQCFFIRVPQGLDRDAAFAGAAKALRSMRFRDFGTLVLRAPAQGAWFVVDWVGPFELSDELMRSVSGDLRTEVLGLGMTVAHGRPGDFLHLHRFVNGEAVAGHRVEAKEDRVTPVIGDALRLPSTVHLDEVHAVAAALSWPPGGALAESSRVKRVELRCVPGRLLVWAVVLIAGAAAVLIFT